MNKNTALQTSLQYGAYSGLCSFALFLLIYYAGHNPLGNWSWLGIWIPVVFIVKGIKFHRNNYLEGIITYGQGLGTGIMTAVSGALVFSMLVYIIGTAMIPSLPEIQYNEAVEGVKKASQVLGEDMYDKFVSKLEETKESFTLKSLAVNEFFSKTTWGFLISLVAAAVCKKSKPPFS